MANYYGFGRTNYVSLRDEQAYATFAAAVALLGGSTEEEDGEFSRRVTAEEIVASGYVSVHEDSLLNAGLPQWLAQVANPGMEVDEDEDGCDGCDLLYELYPLLGPGQVLVFRTVGQEKRRYVDGRAEAINEQGQRVSVGLDDIYEIATRSFGVTVGETD